MNLLMHMCCGPCSCYPLQSLQKQGHNVTGFFFNPNIHPYKEFKERFSSAIDFCNSKNIEIIVNKQYQLREFLTKALIIEKNTDGLNTDGRRCRMCYAWRLNETAKYAKANNYDGFTSTLFVSPYQDHNMMKSIAEKVSKSVDIPFYYEDFRPGFSLGTEQSIAMGLYRQSYCGCIFSEEERYSNAFKKARKKKYKALAAANTEIENKKLI